MPNLQNAKKALRQANKRAEENKIVKIAMKKAIKEVSKAIQAGEKEMKAKLSLVQKKLDKAAKKGVIKKNTASRKFSRLVKQANKVK
ncbi:MAG: 30S ribosomal protein S20 [Candidatus Magasanikbacteria bacterium]